MTTLTVDTLSDRIRSVADEVIDDPLFVVEVAVRGQKGSRVVEVFIDSDEQLTVKQISNTSREIGFLLESRDVVDGRYKLNVSSPGVDRPLILPRQFRKNLGREVSVSFQDVERKPLKGKLVEADDEGFVLGQKNNDNNRLSYGDVKEVHVLLPW